MRKTVFILACSTFPGKVLANIGTHCCCLVIAAAAVIVINLQESVIPTSISGTHHFVNFFYGWCQAVARVGVHQSDVPVSVSGKLLLLWHVCPNSCCWQWCCRHWDCCCLRFFFLFWNHHHFFQFFLLFFFLFLIIFFFFFSFSHSFICCLFFGD